MLQHLSLQSHARLRLHLHVHVHLRHLSTRLGLRRRLHPLHRLELGSRLVLRPLRRVVRHLLRFAGRSGPSGSGFTRCSCPGCGSLSSCSFRSSPLCSRCLRRSIFCVFSSHGIGSRDHKGLGEGRLRDRERREASCKQHLRCAQ